MGRFSYLCKTIFLKALYSVWVPVGIFLSITASFPVCAEKDISDSLLTYSRSSSSDIALFFRLIFALAIVIILLILTLWLLRYLMRSKMTGGDFGFIDVVTIRYIEPKKAIALVRVVQRIMIIGIAENSITILGELTPEETGSLKLDRTSELSAFQRLFAAVSKKKADPGA